MIIPGVRWDVHIALPWRDWERRPEWFVCGRQPSWYLVVALFGLGFSLSDLREYDRVSSLIQMELDRCKPPPR